jgi:hypothetical protein
VQPELLTGEAPESDEAGALENIFLRMASSLVSASV